MKEYYFYFKSDTKKEALSKAKASSLEDAIQDVLDTYDVEIREEDN